MEVLAKGPNGSWWKNSFDQYAIKLANSNYSTLGGTVLLRWTGRSRFKLGEKTVAGATREKFPKDWCIVAIISYETPTDPFVGPGVVLDRFSTFLTMIKFPCASTVYCFTHYGREGLIALPGGCFDVLKAPHFLYDQRLSGWQIGLGVFSAYYLLVRECDCGKGELEHCQTRGYILSECCQD